MARINNDQTGAFWSDGDGGNVNLFEIDPNPKFGQAYIGFDSDNYAFSRALDQSGSGQPNSFSIGSKTTLQVSTWVYLDSRGAHGDYTFDIDVGKFQEPSNVVFRMTLLGRNLSVVFVGSSIAGSDTFELPLDEWVYVLLQHSNPGIEPVVTELYVNGELAASLSEVDQSTYLSEIDPINAISISGTGLGLYLDEIRGALGSPLITGSFTPPTTPWPNP